MISGIFEERLGKLNYSTEEMQQANMHMFKNFAPT